MVNTEHKVEGNTKRVHATSTLKMQARQRAGYEKARQDVSRLFTGLHTVKGEVQDQIKNIMQSDHSILKINPLTIRTIYTQYRNHPVFEEYLGQDFFQTLERQRLVAAGIARTVLNKAAAKRRLILTYLQRVGVDLASKYPAEIVRHIISYMYSDLEIIHAKMGII